MFWQFSIDLIYKKEVFSIELIFERTSSADLSSK